MANDPIPNMTPIADVEAALIAGADETPVIAAGETQEIVTDAELAEPAPPGADDATEEAAEDTESVETPADPVSDAEAAVALAEATPDELAGLLADPAFLADFGGKEKVLELLKQGRESVRPFGSYDAFKAQIDANSQAAETQRQAKLDEIRTDQATQRIVDRAEEIARKQLREEWEADNRDPDYEQETFDRLVGIRQNTTVYEAAQEINADLATRHSGLTKLLEQFPDAVPAFVEEVVQLSNLAPAQALAAAAKYAELGHAHTQAKIAPFRQLTMQAQNETKRVQTEFDEYKAGEQKRIDAAVLAAKLTVSKELSASGARSINQAGHDDTEESNSGLVDKLLGRFRRTPAEAVEAALG